MTETGLIVAFILSVLFGLAIGVLLGFAMIIIWNNPNKAKTDGWE